MGCWTKTERFSPDAKSHWHPARSNPDGSCFDVICHSKKVGTVEWELSGRHNISNALAALAAARHVGVPPATAVESLSSFHNVRRRMELRGEVNGVKVYDDFAHHPTAIETTLAGLRARVGDERIIAVLELRSNTMRMGVHADQLASSLWAADGVMVYAPPELGLDVDRVFAELGDRVQLHASVADIVAAVGADAQAGDHVLVMSNGGFENIHQRLLDTLVSSSIVVG
jgi:UDP-N-acetylmuramate: L-alanyl-gamma-D-glutamyl-meso-diaminopimelate ligase